jgi:endonuclease I
MKKNFLLTVLMAASFGLVAQSPVPTSWDCSTGTPPTGWTFDNLSGGNTNYTASSSCDGAASLRLDATNEALTIFFGQQPGAINYQIGGSIASGSWAGTFKLQESVDGMAWVDMHTYADGELPVLTAPCLSETYTPANSASRYIRFFFANKVSGSNIKIDEISVAAPAIEGATIRVTESAGATVLDGSVAQPFNSNSVTYNIINDGIAGTLDISNITITGMNQADFTVTSPVTPTSIMPGESIPLTISFAPSAGNGTYNASVAIVSNDMNNLSYDFSLYGVSGDFATEPATGVSSVTASVNKSYRTVVNFTGTVLNNDVLGGYILLRSAGAPISQAPADGMVYQKGMSIGNAKVVFAGRPSVEANAIKARYVEAGTEYHFAVFPYNGSGAFTNYLETINDNVVSSPASMASPTEYTGISTDSPSFVTDLKALINPHTSIFYSNYTSTMINLLVSRDTFATVGANTFTKVINCSYSGEVRLYNEPFDWSGLGYSREHTFPHSWMPSFPADNPEQPEYNDQHNLYPTRQTNVNDVRCNYPLGEVVTEEAAFLEGKLGLDVNGKRVYEPRNSHKGRAARALMYQATCYNTDAMNFNFDRPIGNTCSGVGINYPQDQNVIKKWHAMYPPDNFDASRNDFLDSLQTNRNPFVDQPDYACYIDFSNMSKIDAPANPCYTTGVEKIHNMHLAAFPNPSNGTFRVSFKGSGEKLQLSFVDLTGKIVFTKGINASNEVNIIDFNSEILSSGMYLMTIQGTKSFASIPVVITQ